MANPNENVQSLLSFLDAPRQQPGASMLTESPGFLEGMQSVGYSMAAGVSHARALMADTDAEMNLHRQAAEEMTRKASALTNEASLTNLFGTGTSFLASMAVGGGVGSIAGRLGAEALGKLVAGTVGATIPNLPQAYGENVNTQLEHEVPYKQALSDAIAPAALSAGLDSVAPMLAIGRGLAGKPTEQAANAAGDSFLKGLGKMAGAEYATGAAQSGIALAGVDDAYQKYDVLSQKGLEEMAKSGMMEVVAGSPYMAGAAAINRPTPTLAPAAEQPPAITAIAPNTGEVLGESAGPLPPEAPEQDTISPAQARASRAAELLANAGKGNEFLTLRQLNDFTKNLITEIGGDASDAKALASQLMKSSRFDVDGKSAYNASTIATELDSRLPIFAAGIEQKNAVRTNKANNETLEQVGVVTPSTGLTEQDVTKAFGKKVYDTPAVELPNGDLFGYDTPKQLNANQQEIAQRFANDQGVTETFDNTPMIPGQTPQLEMFGLGGQVTPQALNMLALPAPTTGLTEEQLAKAAETLAAEQQQRISPSPMQEQQPVLIRNQELGLGGNQAIPVLPTGQAAVDGLGIDVLRQGETAAPTSWKQDQTLTSVLPKSGLLRKAVDEANTVEEAIQAVGAFNKGTTRKKATDIVLALNKLMPQQTVAPTPTMGESPSVVVPGLANTQGTSTQAAQSAQQQPTQQQAFTMPALPPTAIGQMEDQAVQSAQQQPTQQQAVQLPTPALDITDENTPASKIKLSSRKTGYKTPVAAIAAAKKAGTKDPLPVKLKDGTFGYTTQELLDAPIDPLDSVQVPADLRTDKINAKAAAKGVTTRQWLQAVLERKAPFDDQLSEAPNSLANRVRLFVDNLGDIDDPLIDQVWEHVNELDITALAIRDIQEEDRAKSAKAGEKPAKKAETKKAPANKKADKKFSAKLLDTKAKIDQTVIDAANKALVRPDLKKRTVAALNQPTSTEALTSLDRLLDEYEDNDTFVSYLMKIRNLAAKSQDERAKKRAAAFGNDVTIITDPAELGRIKAELEANRKLKEQMPNTPEKMEQMKRESFDAKKNGKTVAAREEAPLDTNVDNDSGFAVTNDAASNPLLRREVRIIADDILSNFSTPPLVKVISDLSEAPKSITESAEKAGFDGNTAQVKGFFHKGIMYVVSTAHDNKASVERTVYHEAFHLGLRQALSPAAFMRMLNNAIGAMGGTDGVIKFAKQMGTYERLLPYIDKYAQDVADGTRSRQSADRMLLEEALAPLAETNSVPKLSMLAKFLGSIARALDAVGADKLAAGVRKWSPNLVAKVFLDIANRGLESGTPAQEQSDSGFMAVTSPSQLSDVAKAKYNSIKKTAEDTRAAFNKLPYRTGVRKLAEYLSAMGGKGAVFTARQLVSSTKGMLTSLAASFEQNGKPELGVKLKDMIKRLETIATRQDVIANQFLNEAFRSLENLPETSQKKTWDVFQLELTPEQAAKRLNEEEMQAYKKLRKTFDNFFDQVMRPAYEREANILLADGSRTDSVMELAVGMGDYAVRAGKFVKVGKGQGTHRLTNYRANYSPRIYDREKIRANEEQFKKDMMARTGMSEEQAEGLFDDIMDDTTNIAQIGQAPMVGMGKSGSQKARKINLPNAAFEGYLSKDLGAVLPVYLNRTVQHSLFTQEFGRMQTAADGSLRMTKGNEWAEIHNAIENEDDRVVFRRIMNTVTSRTGLTDSSLARTASSGLRAFGSMMMMSLILLKSLGDVAWIVAAGKNSIERGAARQALKDITNAMMNGDKARSVAANRIFYQHAGLVTNAVMDRTLADLTDIASTEGWEGKFNRATTKFYQRTGIHHLTTILRNVALDAGQIAVDHSIAIMNDANTTEKEKADAADTLNRFGVDVDKWNLWSQAGKPTVTQALEAGDPALAAAAENAITTLAKFRNSHVAHPTQLDKTLWADNAIGKLFWQFHSYFYALQNNVMTGFFENIGDHKFGEAFKQMAMYIPIAMVVGGAGLYAAHALQFAAPAAFWGDPVPPHSMTNMDFGNAALEALKYTALSGFSAESWSTAANMPGGFMDITNLAPSVGLFTRTLDVDGFASAPADLAGNIKSLADNLVYAAGVYGIVGPVSDKAMEGRQREIERLTNK